MSGGTYEYGYRYLRPWLGFIAGWMFVCAKTASAATAALGFSGYLLNTLGHSDELLTGAAVGVVAATTLVVMCGMRQSNRTNIVIVSITLFSLGSFVVAGVPTAFSSGNENLMPFFDGSIESIFHACALMFVAYTGYGRIATLGEEVHEPVRTIPRAIITTLVISSVVYVAVATVGIAAVGAGAMQAAAEQNGAPLEMVAREFTIPTVHGIVAVWAMTAMLGVLLNLILGLSRVLLAMGRRGDMPSVVASLNRAGTTPFVAVLVVGVVVAGLALAGNVKTTWSFSAFSVLIYYAITNMAALQLRSDDRLFSPLFAWTGLVACLFLAFFVEWQIWAAGLALIVVGLIWHMIARRLAGS